MTSLDMFRDVLGVLEQFLPFRGIRKGLTKLVTFDLRPQKMSLQMRRIHYAETSQEQQSSMRKVTEGQSYKWIWETKKTSG